jgi:hypothetical protein
VLAKKSSRSAISSNPRSMEEAFDSEMGTITSRADGRMDFSAGTGHSIGTANSAG